MYMFDNVTEPFFGSQLRQKTSMLFKTEFPNMNTFTLYIINGTELFHNYNLST